MGCMSIADVCCTVHVKCVVCMSIVCVLWCGYVVECICGWYLIFICEFLVDMY